MMDTSGLAGGGVQLTADGGDGADVLIGGAGNDILLGGEGDDVLIGGPGSDGLDGGPGKNIIIQDELLNDNRKQDARRGAAEAQRIAPSHRPCRVWRLPSHR